MNVTIKGSFLLGGIALAGLLGGCAADNPWGTESDSKGKIRLSLETDGEVKSARPVFRSGENGFQASDYLTKPEAEDLSIRLEKNDGSFSKEWTSLRAFNEDEASFAAGTYTLTAYYGEKGTQGFERPYFEGVSTLNVLSEQTTEVNVTAALANTMVVIDYTDDFKEYMSAWEATIFTEGVTGGITYPRGETRAAFIEPKEAYLHLAFTTKEGKSTTVSLNKFTPEAKSLYHVTFDVDGRETDTATLSVTFDDTLIDEPVEIYLTEELFTTPAPEIEAVGFTDNAVIDMLEGTASDITLKMNVKAPAGIKSAKLTVNSTPTYAPAWGNEIDLCAATPAQQNYILNAGITVSGLYKNPDRLAFLDFTEFGKSLPKGRHTIQLIVEDNNGAVSQPMSIILDSQEIQIAVIDQSIIYGSGKATLTLDYNGANPSHDVTFEAQDQYGQWVNSPVESCQEITATRGFDLKRYVFTVNLPTTTKKVIKMKAIHKGKEIGRFDVPVTTPEYSVASDAYANSVDLKITTETSSALAAIIDNIKVKDSNNNAISIYRSDKSSGIITIANLSPSTTYTLLTTIDGGETWKDGINFTTESELTIPNGDFGTLGTKLESGTLEVGGKYKYTVLYQLKSSFKYDQPQDWANINSYTAYSGSTCKNTWFIVPSTWVENGTAVIQSVAFDHNGTKPADATKNSWYCPNVPTFKDENKVAGELFLGTYLYNGTVSRTDGISFGSRPASISFEYNYKPVDNGSDSGLVYIEIKNASDQTIYKESTSLTGSGTKTITPKYLFGEKASKLYISFKSSNSTVAPIHIPSGSELDEGMGGMHFGNLTLDANTYHAVATGSVLKIDNVKANYDRFGSASGAPKRKTTKAKK